MERQSALNPRHRELGSPLESDNTWNGMPVPSGYSRDPQDEVVAVRTAAGLFDISALNTLRVSGPDAAAVIDSMCAIDVHRLKPGQARLAAIVNEQGAITDDLMVVCDGPEQYRLSHGSGNTREQLEKLGAGRKLSFEQDYDIHILSLQGPRSADVLGKNIDIDLSSLPYFEHRQTRAFGVPVTVSRGGYSGEQGFELSCAAADALKLWDAILDAGVKFGTIACSWEALDLARVEAALLFFPYDMPEGDTTPWEVKLGWMVDVDKKADYVGKAALLAARGKERFFQAGAVVQHDDAVAGGARVFAGGNDVGVVTSAVFSRYLMKSLAMVHLEPGFNALGVALEIEHDGGRLPAVVSQTPFYDPLRLRARV